MTKKPTIISKNILRLLNERGISANKLQNDLKLSNNAVTYWKSGRSSPSQKTLEKISKYFEVPLCYFYSDNESSPSSDFPISFEEFSAEFDKNERLKQIAALPPEKQKIVFDTIDALLKNLEK